MRRNTILVERNCSPRANKAVKRGRRASLVLYFGIQMIRCVIDLMCKRCAWRKSCTERIFPTRRLSTRMCLHFTPAQELIQSRGMTMTTDRTEMLSSFHGFELRTFESSASSISSKPRCSDKIGGDQDP